MVLSMLCQYKLVIIEPITLRKPSWQNQNLYLSHVPSVEKFIGYIKKIWGEEAFVNNAVVLFP